MDVPHALFNHSGHQMYALPPGVHIPAASIGRSEGEVVATIIQHQQQQQSQQQQHQHQPQHHQQQHQVHEVEHSVEVVTESLPQGYPRMNIPASMAVRIPWMDQDLPGKAPPPASTAPLPPKPSPTPPMHVHVEERNDEQSPPAHSSRVQEKTEQVYHQVVSDEDMEPWNDVKPQAPVRKRRERKPSTPEPEEINDEIISNYVPLTWSKSLHPKMAKMEKGESSTDGPAEDDEDEKAMLQSIFKQPVGYTCVQCGHVVQHNQLVRHARGHMADRPFKCEVCKRSFRQKSNLIVHTRMHTGELPFPCDICGKAFRQKSILVTHVRTHTREAPYKCTLCPKAFTQKSNLVEHVRIHTGEKPYVCPECSKAFAQKSNLVVHIRSHTGEAPFKCGVCAKAFRQKSILTTHMRTHTGEVPYKCGVCERGFAQKSNLVEHMRQHTGEKPYVCEDCDKAFIRHQDLLQHMRHHTGRKPYECPSCGKMFVRKKHMDKHYQTHLTYRFNCRICGLGFMDENLMVIHLTTHFHCHICDVKFDTREELTEHCRLHSIGMSEEQVLSSQVQESTEERQQSFPPTSTSARIPTSLNAASNPVIQLPRIDDRGGSSKYKEPDNRPYRLVTISSDGTSETTGYLPAQSR